MILGFSYPVAIYRFAFPDTPDWLTKFPANTDLKNELSEEIDRTVSWIAESFGFAFGVITDIINMVLNAME